jgi:hypothetical protein
MSDVNQFPTGKNKWESYTTEKEVQYEIRRVLPNEIFGHQEVIEALQREKDSEVYPATPRVLSYRGEWNKGPRVEAKRAGDPIDNYLGDCTLHSDHAEQGLFPPV